MKVGSLRHHLDNSMVRDGIPPEVVEVSLNSMIYKETQPLAMTADEWAILVDLMSQFKIVGWRSFELAAQVCEKYSDGKDFLAGMAILLYTESARRARHSQKGN